MEYKFDIIKNRWLLALVFISVIIFPLIPFVVLNVRVWFPIPPNIFISLGIPVLISAFISLLIAKNKQQLFWTKICLVIDEKELNFKINQKQFSFYDLEYFTYRRGSALTTGIKRPVLFLKLKSENLKVIMPCKSSLEIEHYDRFIIEFDRIKTDKKFKSRVFIS